MSFSLHGTQWEVGIGFNLATSDGGLHVNKEIFYIKDLITAVDFSTILLKTINEAILNDA